MVREDMEHKSKLRFTMLRWCKKERPGGRPVLTTVQKCSKETQLLMEDDLPLASCRQKQSQLLDCILGLLCSLLWFKKWKVGTYVVWVHVPEYMLPASLLLRCRLFYFYIGLCTRALCVWRSFCSWVTLTVSHSLSSLLQHPQIKSVFTLKRKEIQSSWCDADFRRENWNVMTHCLYSLDLLAEHTNSLLFSK